MSDHNVFLEGARKSCFEGEHSVAEASETGFKRENSKDGIRVSLKITGAPRCVNAPWVGPALLPVGFLPWMNLTIEDRDGHPITVDTDYYGTPRKQIIAGPWAVLDNGTVEITWP